MMFYRRLIELIKPYWSKLTIAMICMVFVSLLEGGQAYLVKPALDEVFINKDAKKLFLLPFVIVILFLAKGIFNYVQAYLMNFVGLRVVANLREKLYNHLQTLSLSFFTKTSTGTLISRITNDVNLIQGAVSNTIAGILKDAFTIFSLLGVIFYQSWKLGIIALIIFPFGIIPIIGLGKRMRKFARKGQQRYGFITTFLHETITGSRVVKGFNMEEYEKRRFAEENDRLFRTFLKRVRIRALSHPLMELLGGIAAAIIIWVGGYMIMGGELTPGPFLSFLAAFFML